MTGLFASALLAGCADRAPEETDQIVWGAGPWSAPGLGRANITLPPVGDPDLPPGPFLEGAADLQVLDEFLTNGTAPIRSECGAPDDVRAGVVYQLRRGNYPYAIDAAARACAHDIFEAARGIAPAKIQAGTEEQTKLELARQALDELDNLAVAISGVNGAGNTAEAGFLARVMTKHASGIHLIGVYLNDTFPPPDERTIRYHEIVEDAYANLIGQRRTAEALVTMIETYPWRGSKCTSAQDVDSLIAGIDIKVQKLQNITEAYEAWTGVQERIPAPIFDFRNAVIPRFEDFRAHRWVEGLRELDAWTSRDLEYWAGLDEPEHWPSFEEARGMFAWSRNQSRTMYTEGVLIGFRNDFEAMRPDVIEKWYEDTSEGAAGFYGVMGHLRWPHAGLQCPT